MPFINLNNMKKVLKVVSHIQRLKLNILIDFQKAEKLDLSNYEIKKKVKELTIKVEEDREKKKKEVFDNLKYLGNSLLGITIIINNLLYI